MVIPVGGHATGVPPDPMSNEVANPPGAKLDASNILDTGAAGDEAAGAGAIKRSSRQLQCVINPSDHADHVAHVNVRSTPRNARRKLATVLTGEPMASPWVLSSEGYTNFEALDAPHAHLRYLAAGLGLFLLSDAEFLAKRSQLNIADTYLEKRLSWTPNRLDFEQNGRVLPYGKAEFVDLVLIFKSRTTNQRGDELQLFCRQVQRTIQAITAADQISVTVILDGRIAGQINRTFGDGAMLQSR